MLLNDTNYFQILENIKTQIQNARYRAVLRVNREQIFPYWNIGRILVENQKYGNKLYPASKTACACLFVHRRFSPDTVKKLVANVVSLRYLQLPTQVLGHV